MSPEFYGPDDYVMNPLNLKEPLAIMAGQDCRSNTRKITYPQFAAKIILNTEGSNLNVLVYAVILYLLDYDSENGTTYFQTLVRATLE